MRMDTNARSKFKEAKQYSGDLGICHPFELFQISLFNDSLLINILEYLINLVMNVIIT